jgi:hypothetical protein
LLGKSEEELQKQIQTFTTFSDDIYMEFGLDKCTEIVFKKGKLVHSQNIVWTLTEKYKRLNRESDGIQHQQMKERLKK